MTLPQDFIGVDIAKGWIDVFYLSTLKHERIVTTKQSLARFSKATAGCLVICEASGGYERPLTEALAKAGTDYARVNPVKPANSPVRQGGWPKPTASMRWFWPRWAAH